jgi:hypothetical protein
MKPGAIMDNQRFTFNQYVLKRQILALTGKVRLYGPGDMLLLYAEQKMLKLKEDIRLYASDDKLHAIMHIQARSIIDFSAAYDVFDSDTGMPVGTLRRKGWRSVLRDEWEILGSNGELIALIREDSQGRALARRFLLGSLLPQSYDLLSPQNQVLGAYHQRLNLFRYVMDIELPTARIDQRLALAGGILLAIIEGKQDS